MSPYVSLFGHSFCKDFRAGSSISSFGSSSPNGFCFGGAPFAESCLRMLRAPWVPRPWCVGRSSGIQWLEQKRSDESSHYWEIVETGGLIESGGNFRTLIQRECLVEMTSVDLLNLLVWSLLIHEPTGQTFHQPLDCPERGIRSIKP